MSGGGKDEDAKLLSIFLVKKEKYNEIVSDIQSITYNEDDIINYFNCLCSKYGVLGNDGRFYIINSYVNCFNIKNTISRSINSEEILKPNENNWFSILIYDQTVYVSSQLPDIDKQYVKSKPGTFFHELKDEFNFVPVFKKYGESYDNGGAGGGGAGGGGAGGGGAGGGGAGADSMSDYELLENLTNTINSDKILYYLVSIQNIEDSHPNIVTTDTSVSDIYKMLNYYLSLLVVDINFEKNNNMISDLLNSIKNNNIYVSEPLNEKINYLLRKKQKIEDIPNSAPELYISGIDLTKLLIKTVGLSCHELVRETCINYYKKLTIFTENIKENNEYTGSIKMLTNAAIENVQKPRNYLKIGIKLGKQQTPRFDITISSNKKYLSLKSYLQMTEIKNMDDRIGNPMHNAYWFDQIFYKKGDNPISNKEVAEFAYEDMPTTNNQYGIPVKVFLIFGESGSGKTSFFINLNKENAGENRIGVMIHMCYLEKNRLMEIEKNASKNIYIVLTRAELCHKKDDSCKHFDNEKMIFAWDEEKGDFICIFGKFKKKNITRLKNELVNDGESKDNDGESKDNDCANDKQTECPVVDRSIGEVIKMLVDYDRMVDATLNNDVSSRSHVLGFLNFCLSDEQFTTVNEQNINILEQNKQSIMVIVDLAGNENVDNCNDTSIKQAFLNLKGHKRNEEDPDSYAYLIDKIRTDVDFDDNKFKDRFKETFCIGNQQNSSTSSKNKPVVNVCDEIKETSSELADIIYEYLLKLYNKPYNENNSVTSSLLNLNIEEYDKMVNTYKNLVTEEYDNMLKIKAESSSLKGKQWYVAKCNNVEYKKRIGSTILKDVVCNGSYESDIKIKDEESSIGIENFEYINILSLKLLCDQKDLPEINKFKTSHPKIEIYVEDSTKYVYIRHLTNNHFLIIKRLSEKIKEEMRGYFEIAYIEGNSANFNSVKHGEQKLISQHKIYWKEKEKDSGDKQDFLINRIKIGHYTTATNLTKHNEFETQIQKDHQLLNSWFDNTSDEFTFYAPSQLGLMAKYTIDVPFHEFCFGMLKIKTDINHTVFKKTLDNFIIFLRKQQQLLYDVSKFCEERAREGRFINEEIRNFRSAISAIYDAKNGGNPVLLRDIPGYIDTSNYHTFDVFKEYNNKNLYTNISKSKIMKTIFDAWSPNVKDENEDAKSISFAKSSDFSTFVMYNIGEDHEKSGKRLKYIQLNELIDFIKKIKFEYECEPVVEETKKFNAMRNTYFKQLYDIIIDTKIEILKKASVNIDLTTQDNDQDLLTIEIQKLRIAELTGLFSIVDNCLKSNKNINTFKDFYENIKNIFEAFDNVNSATALGILNSNKNGIYNGDFTMTPMIAEQIGFSTLKPVKK